MYDPDKRKIVVSCDVRFNAINKKIFVIINDKENNNDRVDEDGKSLNKCNQDGSNQNKNECERVPYNLRPRAKATENIIEIT